MADEKKLSAEEAAKAKAEAKAAEKERKERIKRNKPKADPNRPNIFVRILNAIKRFFKDFRGTCKKVIWPDGKTVLKSSAVVLAVSLLIGVCVWVVDFGLSKGIEKSAAALSDVREHNAQVAEEASDDDEAPTEDVTADINAVLEGLTQAPDYEVVTEVEE